MWIEFTDWLTAVLPILIWMDRKVRSEYWHSFHSLSRRQHNGRLFIRIARHLFKCQRLVDVIILVRRAARDSCCSKTRLFFNSTYGV